MPLKGFSVWHMVPFKGTQPHLVKLYIAYQNKEIQERVVLSVKDTVENNFDCVFIKYPLFTSFPGCLKPTEKNWVSDQTWYKT